MPPGPWVPLSVLTSVSPSMLGDTDKHLPGPSSDASLGLPVAPSRQKQEERLDMIPSSVQPYPLPPLGLIFLGMAGRTHKVSFHLGFWVIAWWPLRTGTYGSRRIVPKLEI